MFPAFVYRNRVVSVALAQPFQLTFGISLSYLWDDFMGFDILAFDDKCIHSADGVSMYDTVLASYGEAGVELIQKLLGKVPLSADDAYTAGKWLSHEFVAEYYLRAKAEKWLSDEFAT